MAAFNVPTVATTLRYEQGACRRVVAQVWYINDSMPLTPSGDPPSEMIELKPAEDDDDAAKADSMAAAHGIRGDRVIHDWEATRDMPVGEVVGTRHVLLSVAATAPPNSSRRRGAPSDHHITNARAQSRAWRESKQRIARIANATAHPSP